MIKVKYAEATAITSMALAGLMNDSSRTFPLNSALKLAGLLQQLESKMLPFKKQVSDLVKKHNATPSDNGTLQFYNDIDRATFVAEAAKLNHQIIELEGDPLDSKGWPNLTLSEALVLKPMIAEAEERNAKEIGEESTESSKG